MTTSIRPCFARPIEFTSIGVDFTCGATECTVPSGVYANIISLARAVVANSESGLQDIRMTDDIELEIQSDATMTITWSNTTLRDALGFSGATLAVVDGQWYTATDTPLYLWVPEHQFADQGAFRRMPENQYVGEKSLTGNLSGIAIGSTSFKRDMLFTAEMGENLGVELAKYSSDYNRCLDYFFNRSVQSVPTLYTNPPCNGFWYYQNVNEFIDDCTVTGSEWSTSGGIYFEMLSSPDTYIFCHFEHNGISDWFMSPTFRAGRIRYNVELSFTTAEASTYL